MNKEKKTISLGHGSGGRMTSDLINEVFKEAFSNEYLNPLSDSAHLGKIDMPLAFTTDSFVVTPIFFPGGDIGSLSINGTLNDISVAFAKPLYISCGFIIEEGFEFENLRKIVQSMKKAAQESGVLIVTGDTKVVEKGKGDGVYINTSGIGVMLKNPHPFREVCKGDRIIVSGSIGEHGATIISLRKGFNLISGLKSDCASIFPLVSLLQEEGISPVFIRDPTRGGLAVCLNDIVEGKNIGILIEEKKVPVSMEVRGICELLGIEPYNLACEGRAVFVVPENQCERAILTLRKHPLGANAEEIGIITNDYLGKVIVKTLYGGMRILDKPMSDPMPRIC